MQRQDTTRTLQTGQNTDEHLPVVNGIGGCQGEREYTGGGKWHESL